MIAFRHMAWSTQILIFRGSTHIESHGAGILPQGGFHQPVLRRLAADFGQLGRLLRPQTAHNFTHIVSGLSHSIGQHGRKIARRILWRSIWLMRWLSGRHRH